MNRRLAVLPILALLGLAGSPARAAEPPAAAAPPSGPLTALPYTPSLDPAVMDRVGRSVRRLLQASPAASGWSKNPIPADRPAWSVYAKTGNDNQRFLWGLLEEAAKPDARPRRQHPEDRRLLRRLHGRGGHREGGRGAAQARPGGASPR